MNSTLGLSTQGIFINGHLTQYLDITSRLSNSKRKILTNVFIYKKKDKYKKTILNSGFLTNKASS